MQTPGALPPRASDDIDLHFIQKPASADSFKQSFRLERSAAGCCFDRLPMLCRFFFGARLICSRQIPSDGDVGFEGEAQAQYDEADGEDDDVTLFEILASACLQVNSVCNSHRL